MGSVSMMESPQIIKSGAPLAHHPVSDMQPSKVHSDSLNITVEGMLKPCKVQKCTKQKHLKRLRKVLRNHRTPPAISFEASKLATTETLARRR